MVGLSISSRTRAWASSSDTVRRWRENRYRRFLALCSVREGERILDVGAGAGAALERFNRTNEIVALDLNPLDSDWLRSSNVTVTVGDATKLPFADGEFPLVFSSSVIDDQTRCASQSVYTLQFHRTEELTMAKYRHALPQFSGRLFVTDGGIETTLIFHDGIELPQFASFPLLENPRGLEALYRYFREYGALALRLNTGLVLETATWRASPTWGAKLGYTPERLLEVNSVAVRMLEEIRAAYESDNTPIVISGCLGPRGDGYVPDNAMSATEAARYHQPQIEAFADTSADLVTALTMNYVEEAEGIAQAAMRAGMPVVISFTVETDGTATHRATIGRRDTAG